MEDLAGEVQLSLLGGRPGGAFRSQPPFPLLLQAA